MRLSWTLKDVHDYEGCGALLPGEVCPYCGKVGKDKESKR